MTIHIIIIIKINYLKLMVQLTNFVSIINYRTNNHDFYFKFKIISNQNRIILN